VLPTISVSEIPVRAVVGVWLFGAYGGENALATIAATTTLLWCINVLLPALIGIPIIWRWTYHIIEPQRIPS